ncbi:LysR substrate-binding domain-containing protein [Streptomyces luteolus]|uniref:LysR substrate-binding domain-containing protein n=1 Tax=Streptomyces luteolus TaxID=3043615 RepID=A0ABT6SPU6_9ACTN|nr:LysR substrate-binding domain-containing protein [Streptomyces sp. B-S-A12]MDI3417628.1 LysR substrate-binding domain-containing protein [Streptomyces sp. B-S-A12]
MELRQLEYLLAVVEEASFTRAAARLHVTQPGVSSQIRQLERELGQRLLDRTGRTVRPTEVGATVLEYARSALASVAGARLAVDEYTGLLRGQVAVGTVTLAPELDLPGLLASFHRRHPAVDLSLRESGSDELAAALTAGRLDAAVLAPDRTPPPGVELQIIADEPLVVAVSRDDPFARSGRDRLALTELADRTLITFTHTSGTRGVIDAACAAAGFRPRIAFEASDPRVLARLAAHGMGAAILPEPIARDHPEELHVLSLDPAVRGRLALAWRTAETESPAARAFLSHARTALTTTAPPPP